MLFIFFFISNPKSGNRVMLALKFNYVRLNFINNKNQRRRKEGGREGRREKLTACETCYRMNRDKDELSTLLVKWDPILIEKQQ